MADPKYDQGVRRDKDIIPYVVEVLPEDEFGDLQFDGDLIYGHGADGDVTITADTSLSEDMYYNNLTINSGATLNPNGFRVFVKNTLALNGDFGIKASVSSVATGTLEGTVGVGVSVTDGLGGAGEPDGYVPGYTFSGSGAKNSSVGVASKDFYDLRDAINSYKQRGETFFRAKGGAGGGTGADGADTPGSAGSYPPNANTEGAAGGKGTAGTGGTGGTGGRGGGVVMLSARTITGSGGLYCEGGDGVDGTSGTTGATAPSYTQPASGGYQPPLHNAFHVPGQVYGGTNQVADGGHNPETFHHVAGFSECTEEGHHGFSHYDAPFNWHMPDLPLCNQTATYQPTTTGNGDNNPNYAPQPYNVPGQVPASHYQPGVDYYNPAVLYPGGAGGVGATGQRGGRGGGGALIVVTRKAGTPSYTYNTGVNGALIALDSANV